LDETGHPRGAISRLPVWGKDMPILMLVVWNQDAIIWLNPCFGSFFNFASLYIDLYGFWMFLV